MKRRPEVCPGFFSGFSKAVNRTVRYIRQYSLWDVLFFLSSVTFVLFWVVAQVLAQSLAAQFQYAYDIWYYLRNLMTALGISGLLYLAAGYLPRLGRIPKIMANGVVIGMFLCTLLICIAVMILSIEPVSAPAAYFSYVDSATILQGRIIDSYRLTGCSEVFPQYLADLDMWNLSRLMEDQLLCLLAYRYGSWLVVLLSVIAVVWTVSAIRIYLKLYSRWFEWVFLTSFFPAAYQIITPVLYAAGLLDSTYSIMDPFYACDVVTICVFLMIPLAAMLVITKRNHDML